MRLVAAIASLIFSTLAGAQASFDGGVPMQQTPQQTTVTGTAYRTLPDERATSLVQRAEMDARLPRSAPDALRYEPGVFVQQTAHGQGSAYIRGLTGQQTVMLFDGIRLNNSTYRQGPNQYFFTLDSRTISSIEVLRGGGSTLFGTDALGGVIAALPLTPPEHAGDGVQPLLFLRGATADREYGGRVQLSGGALDGRVRFLAGVGGRRVGLLQSPGPVVSPEDGTPTEVPRFAEDGRTQLGTGFDELTADARLVMKVTEAHQLTVAGYSYQQFNAPRTDQCPPATARFDECLVYDEQWRSLVYAAWDARLGAVADEARATISWQRQHERRTSSRPSSFVESQGRDNVDTLGLTLKARAATWAPSSYVTFRLDYGADSYLDFVRSAAWLSFTDVNVTIARSRGQYVEGSRYLYGGAFVRGAATIAERVTARLGARLGWISARAPADPEAGSAAVEQSWFPVVASAGLEWMPADRVSLLANVDRSFRAPNLDDLTSRQQTGPGFQFENAALKPELATTFEVGLKSRSRPLTVELWAFRTALDGAVAKSPRETASCPPQTPQCNASRVRFQLVNLPGTATLHGVEGVIRARLPQGFSIRTTASWTTGDGPSLAAVTASTTARVPLSRVPPLNGTAELGWVHPSGLATGASLRWAATQDRLAIADRSDSRIPLGGTPGFAVADLRLSYRWNRQALFAAVFENVFDTPYRYHGSSVNGAGRGVMLTVEVSPFNSHSEDPP